MDQMSGPPFADLRVKNLRKHLEPFVLEADFSVHVGERAALVGESGSGKTTLLRILAGLDFLKGSNDGGEIFLGTQKITSLPAQKRNMGMVFQDSTLFPHLNVLENVTFGLRMRGVSRQKREEQALFWLEKVDLASRLTTPIVKLSGGEKQRVSFLRALIWKPQVLLLDEPFSSLDFQLRDRLRKELVDLHQIWPVPLILVTHDQQDVSAIATVRFEMERKQKDQCNQRFSILIRHSS
jgi:ABC-type Fe3+/spermidine/putrescine transport system ATPase subunit